METLPDRRAPGLPDIPYSAYCRVCWLAYYCLWGEKEDHGGTCVHGHEKATDCPQAVNNAKLRAWAAKHVTNPKD